MTLTKSRMSTKPKHWTLYLLECQDGTLYTGITNDLEKRITAHKAGTASKYTQAKKFKQLIASKECKSRSQALKEEWQVKKLPRSKKREYFV